MNMLPSVFLYQKPDHVHFSGPFQETIRFPSSVPVLATYATKFPELQKQLASEEENCKRWRVKQKDVNVKKAQIKLSVLAAARSEIAEVPEQVIQLKVLEEQIKALQGLYSGQQNSDKYQRASKYVKRKISPDRI
jgi:hypothetical protein